MNPIIHSINRLFTGVPAVSSAAGFPARRSLASTLLGTTSVAVLVAQTLVGAPAKATRDKYESHTVAVSLASKTLPDSVYVSGLISRMPAFAPDGTIDRILGNQYADVILSGRLPVPEAVEAWFSTMESGRDARDRLSIELTNLKREVVCSWEVIEAIPYKLHVDLQDEEKGWTLHIFTREIKYVGPGSTAKASASTTQTAATRGSSNPTTGTDASRPQQPAANERSTGGSTGPASDSRTQRGVPSTRTIAAGSIDPRIPGSAPVIRPPSLPKQSGSAYVVTTVDGKVHQVANIIPSDDRRLITLVMADQKRVTFDRTQIKKIDRLAER